MKNSGTSGLLFLQLFWFFSTLLIGSTAFWVVCMTVFSEIESEQPLIETASGVLVRESIAYWIKFTVYAGSSVLAATVAGTWIGLWRDTWGYRVWYGALTLAIVTVIAPYFAILLWLVGCSLNFAPCFR